MGSHVQRIIQSGIRFCRPRGINITTPSNRFATSPISYRSLCSSSSGDTLANLSNGKRVYFVDTLAMDPNQRFSLLQRKADSLRKNIKKMRREADKELIVIQYSHLINLERKAKTTIKNTEHDEERMRLETKESEGTFHVFLSLCVATVCASIIGMAAALMILFDQISKTPT